MYGEWGEFELGDSWGGVGDRSGKWVVCLGDGSTHGGVMTTINNDGTLTAQDDEVCVDQALHSCPLPYHGVTPVTAITRISWHNGRLILTAMAVAGCGARLVPRFRHTYVE